MPTQKEFEDMLHKLYGKKPEYASGPESYFAMKLAIAAKQAEATRQCGIALGWLMETLPAAVKQIRL